ncbi:MFS transporter [Dactylosporangium sp. CA-092794]|uniref:MFS transporter n=1 Tax=Dactylosporangium sp. CA-092794 TaxID=3239929 RepID=UPI003D91E3ED
MSGPAEAEIPLAAPVGGRAGLRRAFVSLRTRNYRLFAVGQFFSSTGLWIQRIGQDWLVLTLTGSVTAVGITTTLQFLPTLLFGLLSGVLADRYPKRRLLLYTQIVAALLSALLAVLTLTHQVQVWHVFVIAFGLGVAAALEIPTRHSFVNELVPPSQLRNAISLNAAIFQLGALIGPAISGYLVHAVGPGYSFAINAGSYLVPMAALLWMRQDALRQPPRPSVTERAGRQLVDGLRYVAQRPDILWTTVLIGTFGTFIASIPVTNAAFARMVFNSGAAGYGMLSSVVAVGSLVGALFAASRDRPRLRTSVIAAMCLSALYVLAGVVPGLIGYAIVAAAIGMMTMTLVTAANSTVQTSAEDHIRGRVMGLYILVFLGGGAAGGPIIGAVAEHYGPRAGMLVNGIAAGLVTVLVAIQLARAVGVRIRVPLPRRPAYVIEVAPSARRRRSAAAVPDPAESPGPPGQGR